MMPGRPTQSMTSRLLGTLAVMLAVGCGDGGRDPDTSVGRAWAVANTAQGSVILRSDDGGRQWRVILEAPDDGLNSIDFFDARHGWAVGDRILRTEDGGTTWNPQELFPGITVVNDVAAIDVGDASGVGTSTPVHTPSHPFGPVTVRAGPDGRWVATPTDLPFLSGGLSALCLDRSGQGLALGVGGELIGVDVFETFRPLLLRTTDGGRSWTSVESNLGDLGLSVGALRNLACIGEDAWIVGVEGEATTPIHDRLVLLHSSDGGVSWVDQRTNLDLSTERTGLFGIAFIDAMHGSAAGLVAVDGVERPLVLRTDDGGAHWRRAVLPDGLQGALVTIDLTADGRGIAAGSGAPGRVGVLVSEDAGATWQAGDLPASIFAVLAVSALP